MVDPKPPQPAGGRGADLVPFKPPRPWLQKRIREIAKNTDNITWGSHAFDRSDERDITDTDALTILRTGQLDDQIEQGESLGEWKGKMTKVLRGRREAGVVVIVIKDAELFVKTVEWEDLR
ncbi:DUF4258 domain-containing protein [Rhizomicrobium electricum]|uniref:DUF4258 domain-containing protein n=1 Tax=Rhizomicrobium electricum TaxID=480070 RepID=A0ABN1EQH7_9PROT|nr:DUF4258 domain-containing protein [Rhizomicrobium electricum]NIJ48891.1 hypothetical protein [Rhizomicrobium electricum]